MRFQGYTDEWEKNRASKLLNFFTTNSLTWENLNYDSGKIQNIHYGIIHKGLPTITDTNIETIPFINSDIKIKNYTLCKTGDLVFTDASEDLDGVAKVIELQNVNTPIIVGLHAIHARDVSNIMVNGFKGYVFSAIPFRKQIYRLSVGTKIYSINSRNFNDVNISIPSKEEQSKIANFLLLIDKKIQTQSKIIEELKSYIFKLNKNIILSVEGEIKNLYELAEIYQPQTISNSKMNDKYKYFVYGANGIIGKYHMFNHKSE